MIADKPLEVSPRAAYTLIGLVAVALFVQRLLLPSNLGDKAQEQFAAYVLDAVQNGNWILQHHTDGSVTSKPPLYTWLAALATVPFDRISLVTLYLPSGLATLGIAWLIYATGSAYFNRMAGFLGGLTYLLSHVAAKQIALARPDGVFSFFVTIAALTAFRAWRLGRGWTWFWLASAGATLSKGPLGLLLASAGLLAVVWENRSHHPISLRGSHWLGIGIFFLITGGWFVLAFIEEGQPLIDKMVFKELVGHAVQDYRGSFPGEHFYNQPMNFLARFAPWSLFACVGFWRVWKRPSADPDERRIERFLFCWFFGGLLVFSLVAHHRGDLLFPLIPAAALLGGRELSSIAQTMKPRTFLGACAIVVVMVFSGNALYYGGALGRNDRVEQTQGMQELARLIHSQGGDSFPLVHVDTQFALQFFLNTMTPLTPVEQAARLLSGPDATFVAVRNYEWLRKHLREKPPQLYEVARWPATGDAYVRIVSNHVRLEWTEHLAAYFNPILVRMHKVRLQQRRGLEFIFRRPDGQGRVEFLNESNEPHKLRVIISKGRGKMVKERELGAGEHWQVDVGS